MIQSVCSPPKAGRMVATPPYVEVRMSLTAYTLCNLRALIAENGGLASLPTPYAAWDPHACEWKVTLTART